MKACFELPFPIGSCVRFTDGDHKGLIATVSSYDIHYRTEASLGTAQSTYTTIHLRAHNRQQWSMQRFVEWGGLELAPELAPMG